MPSEHKRSAWLCIWARHKGRGAFSVDLRAPPCLSVQTTPSFPGLGLHYLTGSEKEVSLLKASCLFRARVGAEVAAAVRCFLFF